MQLTIHISPLLLNKHLSNSWRDGPSRKDPLLLTKPATVGNFWNSPAFLKIYWRISQKVTIHDRKKTLASKLQKFLCFLRPQVFRHEIRFDICTAYFLSKMSQGLQNVGTLMKCKRWQICYTFCYDTMKKSTQERQQKLSLIHIWRCRRS